MLKLQKQIGNKEARERKRMQRNKQRVIAETISLFSQLSYLKVE